METKYFRFNMADDGEDYLWGYATGSGEYVGSDSEDITLGTIQKISYDEAANVLRSWLNECGVVTNTDEIDDAVADAFSAGSISTTFVYEDGGSYEMTIEATDNPVAEWDLNDTKSVPADANKNGEQPFTRVERLWKEATGGEPPAKLCVLSNQSSAIHRDGKWVVVDGSRSDGELIDAIKNFA